MRLFVFPIFLALCAQPVLAVSERPAPPRDRATTIDRLYPELGPDSDGWRELLPILLMDAGSNLPAQSAGTDVIDAIAR